MHQIFLQKLKPIDWPYFTKWWRDKELVDLTSGDHTPMSDKEIKKQITEMVNDKNTHHWTIKADEKIVGHINLNKINNKKAELQIVIGEKEYWGQGIGTAAMAQVLTEAKNFGYETIVVEVRPENSRAVHLYEKMGFKKLGLKKYPDNPNLSETVVMERVIT